MTRILAFGASVVAGFWDPEGGWVHYLGEDLHRKTLEEDEQDFQVYNLGVSGHTTDQILTRLENEIESRKEADVHDLVILITAGGNDALYNSNKKGNEIPIERFQENLKEILEICRRDAEEVYFIGDQPIENSMMKEDMLLSRHSIDAEGREEYMNAARKICEEREAPFLSISENVNIPEFRKKLYDGLHPDTEGHREIYKTVKEFLGQKSSIEGLKCLN